MYILIGIFVLGISVFTFIHALPWVEETCYQLNARGREYTGYAFVTVALFFFFVLLPLGSGLLFTALSH